MITLKKGNIVMEVATELQASVFLRNGYTRVAETTSAVKSGPIVDAKDAEPVSVPESDAPVEPVLASESEVSAEPKKRRRTRKPAL